MQIIIKKLGIRILAILALFALSACGSDSAGDGTENTGTENTGTENTGTENTGTENTGTENTGTENSGTENTGDIEVLGLWDDNFGGWTFIEAESWGSASIVDFDNAGNWAVTQNPEDDEWSPNKFSYVVWTDKGEDGSWWTCTVAYGLETLEEALQTENTSDATDPANSGCGDFAWTMMSARDSIEVLGSWTDNYDTNTEISATAWGTSRIHNYDNSGNWAVTQAPADDEWNANKFSYVVWTEAAEDGSWWTCTVAYGLETLEEALAAENISDDSDPSAGGCGDFPWTQMTPGS